MYDLIITLLRQVSSKRKSHKKLVTSRSVCASTIAKRRKFYTSEGAYLIAIAIDFPYQLCPNGAANRDEFEIARKLRRDSDDKTASYADGFNHV